MILVINHSKHRIDEKYKLFNNFESATIFLNGIGHLDSGLSETIKNVNRLQYGDIEIIKIKPESNIESNPRYMGFGGC